MEQAAYQVITIIRLARKGGIQPIGSSTGTVNVGGRNWDLWVGYNGAMKVFSFVAPSEIATFESDVKLFFDHVTKTQGFPASQQSLISMSFLSLAILLLPLILCSGNMADLILCSFPIRDGTFHRKECPVRCLVLVR
jgi:hypothetical protein